MSIDGEVVTAPVDEHPGLAPHEAIPTDPAAVAATDGLRAATANTVRVGADAIAAGPGRANEGDMAALPSAVTLRNVSLYYGAFRAVKDVTLSVPNNRITALIGPSGCGKSTLLRSINRMNDLVPIARVEGEILFHGENIYADYVDPVEVRRRIGMVFQKPNPFPKSIYDNVAFGPRVNGYKGNTDELVERCLRRAALWDEVKDKLSQSGLTLSGGQQQRLCIARAIQRRCCWPPDSARPDVFRRSFTSSQIAARRRLCSTSSSMLPL